MSVRISPSILAADFSRLAEEANVIADDADMLHIDVMDNHFVPNLTVGLPVVESLARNARIPLDVHLGISDPERWAPAYAEAGAASVTFHAESTHSPLRTVRAIRDAGAEAGLALNPVTPLKPYSGLLTKIDTLLIMSIEPGFGGQKFIDFSLEKIQQAREMIDDLPESARRNSGVWLQVDGGVDSSTIVSCAAAGADSFVAGSAVYRSDNPAAAVRSLREKAESTSHR